MKVTLVMHEDFSRDSKKEFYTLRKHYSISRDRRYSGEPSGINNFIDVEIPERFHPSVSLEGDNAYVWIDERGYMLDEVLGCDSFGNPAIVWKDPKYGFKTTVSLKYEPKCMLAMWR